MKSINLFIVKIDQVYSETFKTEGGLELTASTDVNVSEDSFYKRLVNRTVEVVSVPKNLDTEIKPGYELLIDPSSFYKQIYKEGTQEYQNKVNEEENTYYFPQDLVVCYRENKTKEWIGFGENNIVEPILEQDKLTVLDAVKKDKYKGKVIIKHANSGLKSLGLKNGDKAIASPNGGLDFWFNGKLFWLMPNSYIYGVINEH